MCKCANVQMKDALRKRCVCLWGWRFQNVTLYTVCCAVTDGSACCAWYFALNVTSET